MPNIPPYKLSIKRHRKRKGASENRERVRAHAIQMKSANDDLMKNDALNNGDDNNNNDNGSNIAETAWKILLSIFHRQPFLQSFCLERATFFLLLLSLPLPLLLFHEEILYFTAP